MKEQTADSKDWSVAKMNLEKITNEGVGKGFKNILIFKYMKYILTKC